MLALMAFLLAWNADDDDELGKGTGTAEARAGPPEPEPVPDRLQRAGEGLGKAGLLLLGFVLAAVIELGPYLILDGILGDDGSTTACVDLSGVSDADRATIEAAPAQLTTASGVIDLRELIGSPCEP